MVEASRLATVVKERMAQSPHQVCAYWVQILVDRERYASELRDCLGDAPVVPIVVRGALFDNPNSIVADLIDLIGQHRSAFERFSSMAVSRLSLVLIARNELCTPQAASPACFPEWFPIVGGQTVSTIIEDLTLVAACPLNAPEVQLDEVRAKLFDLEGTILRRLISVRQQDHRASNALLDLVRQRGSAEESYEEILNTALAFRSEIKSPSGFRPSVRERRSFLSRLWGLVMSSSTEQLGSQAKALAQALRIPEGALQDSHETLLTVIGRPSQRDASVAHRFSRNLLVTIGASCQLITAGAHADDYCAYPVALVRSISLDLRRSMANAQDVLDRLQCDG